MAYDSYLKLDQTRWYTGDFSSSNKLTGTIFTDSNLTTPKTLTSYTLTVRMYKPNHLTDLFNKTASIVTAASGTWSYAVATGEMPTPGIYYVKVELSQSGRRESTLNRVELHVLAGPTA